MVRMVSSATVEATLGALLPSGVDTMTADAAADALGVVTQLRSRLDAYEAAVTSRLRRLHSKGESAPAADVHTRCGGVSSREAATKERRSEALDRAPSLAERLASGEATSAHADALADAAAKLDDATRDALFDQESALAHDATRSTPEEFGRICRDLVRVLERDQGISRDRRQRHATRLTKHVDRDGMFVLNARMHPELGNAVFNAIDAETSALVKAGSDRSADRSGVAAEALGSLVVGGHQQRRPAEAEIRLHVDVTTIVDGPHPGSVCEYDNGEPVLPSTVRRLLCNGRIVPIIVDTDGVVLDAGREQRLANRHQRRALRAMYPTCAFPGCDVTFERCEIHHVHPFEHGGLTNLSDLLPLCCRHHHVIHDPGWRLVLRPDRTLVLTRPDGGTTETPLPAGRSRPSDESDPPRRRRSAA